MGKTEEIAAVVAAADSAREVWKVDRVGSDPLRLAGEGSSTAWRETESYGTAVSVSIDASALSALLTATASIAESLSDGWRALPRLKAWVLVPMVAMVTPAIVVKSLISMSCICEMVTMRKRFVRGNSYCIFDLN